MIKPQALWHHDGGVVACMGRGLFLGIIGYNTVSVEPSYTVFEDSDHALEMARELTSKRNRRKLRQHCRSEVCCK